MPSKGRCPSRSSSVGRRRMASGPAPLSGPHGRTKIASISSHHHKDQARARALLPSTRCKQEARLADAGRQLPLHLQRPDGGKRVLPAGGRRCNKELAALSIAVFGNGSVAPPSASKLSKKKKKKRLVAAQRNDANMIDSESSGRHLDVPGSRAQPTTDVPHSVCQQPERPGRSCCLQRFHVPTFFSHFLVSRQHPSVRERRRLFFFFCFLFFGIGASTHHDL